MANWFTELFGGMVDAVVDFAATGIGDARDKVILEGWTGRVFPEKPGTNLGWSQDHPGAPEHDHEDGLTALERFYDQLSPAERAEYFSPPHEPDHGIDR